MLFSSLCLCTWSWIKRRCSLVLPCLSIFSSDLGLQQEPRTISYSKTLLASPEISVFKPRVCSLQPTFFTCLEANEEKAVSGGGVPLFSCRSCVPNPVYFCNSVAVLCIVLLLWNFLTASWPRSPWNILSPWLLSCEAASHFTFFSNFFFFFHPSSQFDFTPAK